MGSTAENARGRHSPGFCRMEKLRKGSEWAIGDFDMCHYLDALFEGTSNMFPEPTTVTTLRYDYTYSHLLPFTRVQPWIVHFGMSRKFLPNTEWINKLWQILSQDRIVLHLFYLQVNTANIHSSIHGVFHIVLDWWDGHEICLGFRPYTAEMELDIQPFSFDQRAIDVGYILST